MTKDEALKLALEALEHWDKWSDHTPPKTTEAITAIKEALMSGTDGAQPEPWEKFCDSNCVWTDHHPDCKLAQRLPLTDEEFRAILRSLSRQQGWDGDGWDLALKEAIEAAHGIKELKEY